ncbi:MAG: CatB-related O-acetyltransferase, partial [Anaeroplasmataceae bacterium]
MKRPNKNDIYLNEYKTSVYLKNVITKKNIIVGDYTYYDDVLYPLDFEIRNVLFHYENFNDMLIIGKFCSIASNTKFIMGAANHRIKSISTYPFNVCGNKWSSITPDHMSQIPYKGDTVVGNDVWIGRESVIMPGINIGDGAIVAANSVVTKNVEPYTIVGGNPARIIRKRFDDKFIELLLKLKWWDFEEEKLDEIIPLLCNEDIDFVKDEL